MRTRASCALVIFTFLCHVRCQHVRNDVATNTNINGITDSDLDWKPQDRAVQLLSATPVYRTPIHPSELIRTRRQVSYSRHRIRRGQATSFGHSFAFDTIWSKPSEAAYVKAESSRFKAVWRKHDVFQFLYPRGLRFSIPDSSRNTRIKDFQLKMNEEFRGNEEGDYVVRGYRRGGQVIYYAPQLKASQGDKIYYVLKVTLGSEYKFDVTVKGVLSIVYGDPHTEENMEENEAYFERPTSSRPEVLNPRPAGGSSGQQAASWSYASVLNTTYSGSLTPEEETRFLGALKGFKTSLTEETEFKFFDPRGLSIIIPANTEALIIRAFHVKVNEEFKTLVPGNYGSTITTLNDGRRNLYYQNLKLNQGDKLYYWMRVEWINGVGETIVKGVLDVKRGDPHAGAPPAPSQPEPDRIDQSQPTSPITSPPPPTTTPPPPTTTPPPPTTTPEPPKITSPPTRPPPPPPECARSSTTSNIYRQTRICKGQILMEHRFNKLDGWKPQVFIGGQNGDSEFVQKDEEFMVFTKDSSNMWLDNGKLVIRPTLLADKYNDSFVKNGELYLEGCTSFVTKQCLRQAFGYLILPPVAAARLTTKDQFSFRYGIVELKAKLPRGNWIVPEMWLEPADDPLAERVVLGMSRGNVDDSVYGWKTLEAGLVGELQSSLGTARSEDRPWPQDFHTFTVEWRPDIIKFFVDNQEVHQVPTVNYSILRREVYISLGVHVAGIRDFPDFIDDKPWKNSEPKRFFNFWEKKELWYSTWNEDSKLQIEYIKVTAI